MFIQTIYGREYQFQIGHYKISTKIANKVITQETNILGYYIYINVINVIFIQYANRIWNSL